MIPKIIHICWLSGDPFPSDIQVCLNSWREYLFDYEIWLWGKVPSGSENREFKGMTVKQMSFDLDSTLWTKQAFENKKYAFAADYIRLYALYTYGGIYLDSDVIMYKSFNELLTLPYFVGQSYSGAFEAAVIGTEKGAKWIDDVLKRYTDRPFVKNDGSFDTVELPKVFANRLNEKYRFVKLSKYIEYSNDNLFYLFDKDFFNSRNAIKVCRTPKSFCAHNYVGSWLKAQSKPSTKAKIRNLLPDCLVNVYFSVMHGVIKRKEIRKYEPAFEKKL